LRGGEVGGAVLGLELKASCLLGRCFMLEPLHQPFCFGYFQDRVSQTICLGWLWTESLLISARIPGVSLQSPALTKYFDQYLDICKTLSITRNLDIKGTVTFRYLLIQINICVLYYFKCSMMGKKRS
jgi:hypothetical protein